MVRPRVRIRFRKQGEVRLLGHRDLVRAWERVFRRAGVGLRMSEGFHPKPRLSFPSALSAGVTGADEVLEAELTAEDLTAGEVQAALAAHLPDGLSINSLQWLPEGTPTAHVARVTYELPVPPERRAGLAERVAGWRNEGPHPIDRGAGHRPLELGELVSAVELTGDVLRIEVRVTRQGTARPRELLESLGMEDGAQQVFRLTRTAVELEP